MAGNSDSLGRLDDVPTVADTNGTSRYDLQSPVYYVGNAPIGTIDTATIWLITKYDLSAMPYSAKIAKGAAWSNRTGATYL